MVGRSGPRARCLSTITTVDLVPLLIEDVYPVESRVTKAETESEFCTAYNAAHSRAEEALHDSPKPRLAAYRRIATSSASAGPALDWPGAATASVDTFPNAGAALVIPYWKEAKPPLLPFLLIYYDRPGPDPDPDPDPADDDDSAALPLAAARDACADAASDAAWPDRLGGRRPPPAVTNAGFRSRSSHRAEPGLAPAEPAEPCAVRRRSALAAGPSSGPARLRPAGPGSRATPSRRAGSPPRCGRGLPGTPPRPGPAAWRPDDAWRRREDDDGAAVSRPAESSGLPPAPAASAAVPGEGLAEPPASDASDAGTKRALPADVSK